MADNIRSIPSVIDGLKPGQRKVMFGAFKKKIAGEIKVDLLIFIERITEEDDDHLLTAVLNDEPPRLLNCQVTSVRSRPTTTERSV